MINGSPLKILCQNRNPLCLEPRAVPTETLRGEPEKSTRLHERNLINVQDVPQKEISFPESILTVLKVLDPPVPGSAILDS